MKEIKLTQGFVALVDDGDYESLNKYNWCINKKGNIIYANRGTRINGKKNTVLMHRQILNPPKGMVCDHIDGNGLNNQRSNIRICSSSENGMNQRKQQNRSSKFKGVCFDKWTGRWMAYIKKNKKPNHIGRFNTAEEAAIAYDKKAIELHGEFANLNFKTA